MGTVVPPKTVTIMVSVSHGVVGGIILLSYAFSATVMATAAFDRV